MSEETRKTITERQAEARRQNGKKSRGPESEDGKRRSSMNAVKHGYWARALQPIHSGPLREDPAEMVQFVNAVLEDLEPGDSVVLRQNALDVAHKLWRQTRAQRWESEGYSSPRSRAEAPGNPEALEFQAWHLRRGANTIRELADSSKSLEELWDALSPIAFHLKVSEKDMYAIDDADVAEVLETLIKENFDTPEEAALVLDDEAEELESKASRLRSAIYPDVVREELESSFTKNAERMVGHASRELDRSLKRYWQLWERLQLAQPTVEGQEDIPEAGSASSADAEGTSSQGAASSDDAGEVAGRDLEALLDKILGRTPEG